MQEFQSLLIILIEPADRSVDAHVDAGGDCVLDAGKRLLIVGRAYEPVVDLLIAGIESDLQIIELGFAEAAAVIFREPYAVRVKARDKPTAFFDELGYILADGRFAARESDL